MNSLALLINTFFFVGKIPVAPGTMGSLATLIFWYFTPHLPFIMTISLLFFIFSFSYYTISITLKETEDKDPQYIVIDEVIGMWIALLPLSHFKLSDSLSLLHMKYILLTFILFRLFDIMKPSIIYRSQFIPGPLGILLDDVIAGIVTCLILIGIISI